MIYALDSLTGRRLQPTKESDIVPVCPCCREDVIAKMGHINIHHWAHKSADCDPWSEPEGRWHVMWKEAFSEGNCEVIIGQHRADIVTNSGCVIELQSSPISVAEIKEREFFYKDMVWIFDFTDKAGHIKMTHKQGSTELRVKWPRKHIEACTKPVFLHLSDDTLFQLKRSYRDGKIMYGNIGRAHEIAQLSILTSTPTDFSNISEITKHIVWEREQQHLERSSSMFPITKDILELFRR
jgi:competence CoiA-like predicted nuclease